MAMRLQEVHPAIVHYPLALLPLSIGADLLGRLTGSEALLALGRATMPVAAGSAAVAAAAGLVAQEAVNAEDEALDMLITHRNINLGLVGVATAMAAWRAKHEEPSAAYLGLGLLGLAAATYTAYLGGHMVYELGVGVKAADGLKPRRAPELRADNAGSVARTAVRDLRRSIPTAIEDTKEGKIVPDVTKRLKRVTK